MLQIENYQNNHLIINIVFKRLGVKAGKDSLPFAIFVTQTKKNELLLSAKHRNPHSNSLRHNSSDDSMLVTSPLIHFLLPLVAIQPLLQA